jgi:phosphotransferase system enzyme I (PtsP)
VLVLLGLGVDSLSMSATRLLPVKSVVRGFTRTQARKLVAAALECESPAQVRALLTGALRHQGLGNLLRPGV